MLDEIMEAVEEYWKQYPDGEEIIANCYAWLNRKLSSVDILPLEMWLDKHEYCPECGEKLTELHRTEWHPEVQCVEQITELVCPNCGE